MRVFAVDVWRKAVPLNAVCLLDAGVVRKKGPGAIPGLRRILEGPERGPVAVGDH